LAEGGRPAPALITLGSNIAPERNLPRAVALLRQNYRLTVRAVSRVYESAPVSASGEIAGEQALFLNAALWVESGGYYGPLALKFQVLRFIELLLGRRRSADRFAPRPIDLDLALWGDCVLSSPHLTLPDPDILTRAHLALPLAEVAPDWPHPLTGQTLAAIAAGFGAVRGIRPRDDLAL
jgi:2-amino-4-hydroxy-6-hydroxymethyldihydropteridine diphosphokinase